jgi:hypothetical protein
MENVGIFLLQWGILRPFGIVYGPLVILWSYGISPPRFGILLRKIWQPCSGCYIFLKLISEHAYCFAVVERCRYQLIVDRYLSAYVHRIESMISKYGLSLFAK